MPETVRLADAVRRAVDWLGDDDQPITVVSAGEPRSWTPARVNAREFGLDWEADLGVPGSTATERSDYPPGLVIAAAYTGHVATGELLTTDGQPSAGLQDKLGGSVLVVGSGSARRRDGAPGYVDPRAVPHDSITEGALRSGDVAALRELDLERAAALLDDLSAPLRAVAAGITAPTEAWLDYCADPYGVAYFVARWQL